VNATTWRRTVVDELVACGVTDAVLCPGSRNAPLAFALHAADVAGRLRLHVRIDERTAGFLALGLALGSGRPVPVATTSGTAAANLLPAVLERRTPGCRARDHRGPTGRAGRHGERARPWRRSGCSARRCALARPWGGTVAQTRAAVGRAGGGRRRAPARPVHLNCRSASP
jgi:2-succinyl-5-enolpyruvyl-6-hydroxy-3-cyclohexene-1-carboxylate synthase